MKWTNVAVLIALTSIGFAPACEGEPPKTANLAANGPPPPASEVASEEPAPTASAAPAAGCNPCPCQPCQGAQIADASVVAIASDAGGAAPTPDAAAPIAVPAAHADVLGTITTTPAYLSSVSVVYLEDAPVDPARGMRARVDNHQMQFTPMVTVIAPGGSVTFVNTDPFPHNVFSPDGKFNMGTIPQNSAAAPKRFDKAGEFTVLCNLHPGMIGYLVVAPSSYFAKADPKGHFHIKDVPPGTYKLTAWAPRLPKVTETITVAGTNVTKDFELHR
jgi:plastocyanin